MRLSRKLLVRQWALTAWMFASLLLPANAQPTAFRIATWNMGDLSHPEGGKAAHAWQLLSAKADVLALQECPAPDESSERLEWYGIYEHSNAILSRWPIVASGLVAANPAWPRDLPWADIQPPSGPTFRVYSVHLTFRRGGTPFLAAAREIEARRILTHASDFDGPVIVAGDFNSIGWILGGQATEPSVRLMLLSGYIDTLAKIGGRTHALLGRLDWIFSRGLTTSSATLGDYSESDHRWLVSSFVADGAITQQMPASGDSNGTVHTVLLFVALLCSIAWWRRRSR